MRITSGHIVDLAADASARAQSKVAAAQQVASSGMRVAVASDDPVAWAAAQREKVRRTLESGTGAAIASSTDSLQQTESALGSINDLLAQARQIAVQGASDSNANERPALALQAQHLFAAALAAANTQASDGTYLLSGSQTGTQPFDATGAYRGDSATRGVQTSEHGSDPVSVPGSLLTATSGVDVLPELAKLATALSTNNVAGIQSSVGVLATAITQVSLARAHAGTSLAALSDAETARQQLDTHLQGTISNLVEADAVGSVTALTQATQALDVSRAVTANVIAALAPAKP